MKRPIMTEEKILNIIRSNGSFSLHKYKWSHDSFRGLIRNMKAKGLIRIWKHTSKEIHYILREEKE